jgi:hypothetical protein
MDSRKRPPAESPPNKGVVRSEGYGTLAFTDGSKVRGDHPTARRNLETDLMEEEVKENPGLGQSPVKLDPKRAKTTEETSNKTSSGEECR